MLKPPSPVLAARSRWSSARSLSLSSQHSVSGPSLTPPPPPSPPPPLPPCPGAVTDVPAKCPKLNCLVDCLLLVCFGGGGCRTKSKDTNGESRAGSSSAGQQWKVNIQKSRSNSTNTSKNKLRQILFGNHCVQTIQPTKSGQDFPKMMSQTVMPSVVDSCQQQKQQQMLCSKCSQINLGHTTIPVKGDSLSVLSLIEVDQARCPQSPQPPITPTSTLTLSPIQTISDGRLRCLSLCSSTGSATAYPNDRSSPIPEPQSAPCLGSRVPGTLRSLFSSRSSSPSNYCRVATCQQLHLHDLTPKCLETFAPSSTCSSCQTCDRPHIGPNHDQVVLVERLCKELPIINHHQHNDQLCHGRPSSNGPSTTAKTTSSLLLQWPLPEYRPQHSPDHLYRSFGY